MAAKIEAIPLGYKLYIYLDGRSYDSHDPIDTVGIVTPLNPVYGECILHGFKGVLNDEVNLEIIRTLHGLGYRFAIINVDEGVKVSRHFQYVDTQDGFDVYRADIEAIVNKGS